tara:strand:+ start:102 stop:761 length:660 start_codon:yes stop_codon:yes gene_type:complete
MNTLELFPVKIFTFDWGGDLDDILERCIVNQKDLGGSFSATEPRDVSQSNPDALRLFPDLKEFIDDSLSEVKKYHNLQCDSLKISSSWVNRYRNRAVLPWHLHPMSAFSGTFCINEAGMLSFKDPVQFRMFESTMPLCDDLKQYDVPTKAGQLIIFPWWMEHGALNMDPVDRWSISFNSMPHGHINMASIKPLQEDVPQEVLDQLPYVPNLSSATLEIK